MSDILWQLQQQIDRLGRRLDVLGRGFRNYKGTKGSDFTTTDLPYEGDYGYQTADNEVQMNCDGTVRAISTAAL